MGLALHRFVVDFFLVVQAVGHDVEPFAAHVQRHAVRQVTAFGQAHAHDGVAGLEKSEEHGLVGGGAAMRLHVGGFGAKNLLDAVDGELLGHVNVLAATVVAAAGVAFGVFVGELRALRGHDGGRGVVFAGDQLDVMLLAGVFSLDGSEDFGVGLFDENIAVVHGSPSRLWFLVLWLFMSKGSKGCPGERLNAFGPLAANGALPRGVPRWHQWLKKPGCLSPVAHRASVT